jgi:hypothetical protein
MYYLLHIVDRRRHIYYRKLEVKKLRADLPYWICLYGLDNIKELFVYDHILQKKPLSVNKILIIFCFKKVMPFMPKPVQSKAVSETS